MRTEEEVPPLHVRAMGVTVRIAVPDKESRDRLARQWSRSLVPEPLEEPVGTITAWKGGPENEASRDYGVTTRVTMAALRATGGLRLNLHAGGVADEDGRLLALVAASGTGKTTATRTLATRLGYVSDETISIDSDGTVYPHPKPLSVIVEPAAKYEKVQLSPDELDLLPTPERAALARLVLLSRGREGERGLARLRLSAALLQLVEQSSSLAQLPRPLRTLVHLVEECGGAWELTYDEITEHVDELVALLAELPDGQTDPPAPHQLLWHNGRSAFPLVAAEDGPLLARLPFAEAVQIDDELVVLTDSHAWLLADLTASIWQQLASPATFEELFAAAQLRFGAHQRAEEVMRAAVATLVQERLVSRGSLS